MATVEVFADVCCPFTHVGLRRLVTRRDELGRTDVVLRVHAWPLELVNGAPLDPSLITAEIAELRAQVAPDLFHHFDAARFPQTSLPAMSLAAAAYQRDDRLGERVSLALRDALFEQGRDVGAPEVLHDLAAAHGVPAPGDDAARSVLADWSEGRRRGVAGSPHFFVHGDDFFCPSLDIRHVEGGLRVTSDTAAFEEFLAVCLA